LHNLVELWLWLQLVLWDFLSDLNLSNPGLLPSHTIKIQFFFIKLIAYLSPKLTITQYWLDGQVDVVTMAEKSVSAHATVQLQFLVKLSCSLIIPLKQT
jgi:hypothetical protein